MTTLSEVPIRSLGHGPNERLSRTAGTVPSFVFIPEASWVAVHQMKQAPVAARNVAAAPAHENPPTEMARRAMAERRPPAIADSATPVDNSEFVPSHVGRLDLRAASGP